MLRRKKLCLCLLLAALLTALLCPAAQATVGEEDALAAYRGIRILVNGSLLSPCAADGAPVEPFIITGTTYLPVRAVANALGLKVSWDEATSTVNLESGATADLGEGEPLATHTDKIMRLAYRDVRLVVDGKAITPRDGNGNLVEPFIIDGTTYLPVRAVANALGVPVEWDGDNYTVSLGVEPEPVYLLRQETSEIRSGAGFATKTVKTMKTYLYNSQGQRTQCTDYSADGTVTIRYSYDAQGRPVLEEATDKSRSVSYAYTASGLLQRQTEKGPDGGVSYEYTYDDEDQVIKYAETYTDPDGRILPQSLTTSYRYDKFGRKTAYTTYLRNGDSHSEQWRYDEAGRVIQWTDIKNHLTVSWDYSYDKLGRLLMERRDDGKDQTSYNYDSDGNVTSCVHSHEGGIDTTVYTYKNGKTTSKVFAGADGSSESWTWTYDAQGEMLSERFVSSGETGHSITRQRSADGLQLLVSQVWDDGSSMTDLTTYDEYGNILTREIDAPGRWERYTYEYIAQ